MAETPHAITLDPADYWHLMAAQARAEVVKLTADVQAERARLHCYVEGQRAGAVFDGLAKKYGLDAKVPYTSDDAACTMTPQPKGKG
ncbi:MAG TPA: hypothetical protein DCP69_10005 [Candidatus Omnitrophica bacterium]|nr:hypothetical protein [Candidatus Omnitrophota bacterium]